MIKMEKDFVINNCKIPILKELNSVEFKMFSINDYEKCDYFEDFFEKINILDIFENALDKNDERLKCLGNDYFRLSQEFKYIEFIKKVFSENDNKCVLFTDMFGKNTDHSYFLQILNGSNCVDLIDRHIIVEQYIYYNNSNKKLFDIGNVNLLITFLKMNLREVGRNTIIFEKKPFVIGGGYDLSLPIWMPNEYFDFYKKIANEYKLYFR